MSGIYNIGHCVMPWWISNCEQGSGTVLVFFYRHSTRMYLVKEKQGDRKTLSASSLHKPKMSDSPNCIIVIKHNEYFPLYFRKTKR